VSALVRVRALVDLASDPRTPENEARNAAVQACKLIAQHQFKIGAPDGQDDADNDPGPGPWPPWPPFAGHHPPTYPGGMSKEDFIRAMNAGAALGDAVGGMFSHMRRAARAAAEVREVAKSARRAPPKRVKR